MPILISKEVYREGHCLFLMRTLYKIIERASIDRLKIYNDIVALHRNALLRLLFNRDNKKPANHRGLFLATESYFWTVATWVPRAA
jgi:hypothetical protein